MEHKYKLYEYNMELIKQGKKTIELRLNDEKRRKIKVGDVIKFISFNDYGQTLLVKVINIYKFNNFEELYKSLPLLKCGYTKENIEKASHKDMEQYYTLNQQLKYGVIGIEIQLL